MGIGVLVFGFYVDGERKKAGRLTGSQPAFGACVVEVGGRAHMPERFRQRSRWSHHEQCCPGEGTQASRAMPSR